MSLGCIHDSDVKIRDTFVYKHTPMQFGWRSVGGVHDVDEWEPREESDGDDDDENDPEDEDDEDGEDEDDLTKTISW